MDEDTTTTLTGLQGDLDTEGKAAKTKVSTLINNIDNEDSQIKTGKENIAEAKKQVAESTTKLLAAEQDIKLQRRQLRGLTQYCEVQADDWDTQTATRKKDYFVISSAVNILSCGKEKCGGEGGAFVQLGSKSMSHKSMANVKNTIRSVLRQAAALNEPELVELQELVSSGKDPLLGAKKLLRKLIEKLITENQADIAEMGECASQLTECKTKRDFALEAVNKLKVELEELGHSVEADKEEFAEKSDEWSSNWNDASETSTVTIPELVDAYEQTREKLTEEKNWLYQAIVVLRKHFGTEANSQNTGPEESASGLETTGDEERKGRKTNAVGGTQSTGAAVVAMLNENLNERKAELAGMRDKHIEELSDLRKLKGELSATAGAAKGRYEFLEHSIKKETTAFNTKMEEFQARLDSASSNGRCVQKLEPCGVQTDTRAKREAEIRALKDAWSSLSVGSPDEGKEPAHWAAY